MCGWVGGGEGVNVIFIYVLEFLIFTSLLLEVETDLNFLPPYTCKIEE